MRFQNIIIDSLAKLSLKDNYMEILINDEVKKVFIDNINILVINTLEATITSALISELVKNNITIIFCDKKRIPQSIVDNIYGVGNTYLRKHEQICWDKDLKNKLWLNIVKNKINNQIDIVKSYFDKRIFNSYSLTDDNCDNVEAMVAKSYFSELFGQKFVRRSDDKINHALNYGYSIILSTFVREINILGFMSEFGIHHKSQSNKFNLASDFMEPFRVFIDKIVLENLNCEFDTYFKDLLINVLNGECLYDGKVMSIGYAISCYVLNLTEILSGNDKEYLEVKICEDQ